LIESKPFYSHAAEIYIEALLVDEELADQVWKAWEAGESDDGTAYLAWMLDDPPPQFWTRG